MTDKLFDWHDVCNGRHSRRVLSDSERESASVLYDNLYHAAELILARYNPCHSSIYARKGTCMRGIYCCETDGGCHHLGENGCKVKSLSCKLWLCTATREKFPQCANALDALALIAKKYNLLGFRACKEDVI